MVNVWSGGQLKTRRATDKEEESNIHVSDPAAQRGALEGRIAIHERMIAESDFESAKQNVRAAAETYIYSNVGDSSQYCIFRAGKAVQYYGQLYCIL